MKKDLRSKSTIIDLAKAADVSTATVDRVLNRREGVHSRTRSHVISVARELGYLTPGVPVDSIGYTLDFLLPGKQLGFMNALAAALQRHAAAHRDKPVARIHLLENYEPEKLTQTLEEIRTSTNGVGLIAIDHILVREALLKLISDDVPVFTLATDISSLPHQGYIGPDNRMAGRLAGQVIGRFLPKEPAKVALFSGSHAYRGHEEREMGFRHAISEAFPHLEILKTQEVHEDDETARKILLKIDKGGAKLGGIYCIGSGAMGIARAMEAMGMAHETAFVCHELYEQSRAFLISGTVDAIIDQNADLLAQRAIERLSLASQGQPLPPIAPIDNRLILKENIPFEPWV